jgi:hypothetical protein
MLSHRCQVLLQLDDEPLELVRRYSVPSYQRWKRLPRELGQLVSGVHHVPDRRLTIGCVLTCDQSDR